MMEYIDIIMNLITWALLLRLLMYTHGIDKYIKFIIVKRAKDEQKENGKASNVSGELRPYKESR